MAKPRGFPLIPHGGLYLTHTLLHQLRRRWHGATPMHRLGRGTSGVLLLARTPAARRGVAAAWREGRVEKTRVYGPLRSDPRFQDLLRRMNLPQGEVGS